MLKIKEVFANHNLFITYRKCKSSKKLTITYYSHDPNKLLPFTLKNKRVNFMAIRLKFYYSII